MPRKITEVISEAEALNLLNGLDNKRKLAYSLGYYQCLRVSEVINLRLEDINYNNKTMHIKQSKGKKDRIIPIMPEIYLGLKYLPFDISIRTLQRWFKHDAKERLGKNLHFHQLRHSGATRLMRSNWTLWEIQRFLGHSFITTTQIYEHIQPIDLINKVWKNEEILAKSDNNRRKLVF